MVYMIFLLPSMNTLYMTKRSSLIAVVTLLSILGLSWIFAQSASNSDVWWNNYCWDWIFMLMLWEECDDGNYIDWDWCSSNCMKELTEEDKEHLRMMPKEFTGERVKRSETLPVEVFDVPTQWEENSNNWNTIIIEVESSPIYNWYKPAVWSVISNWSIWSNWSSQIVSKSKKEICDEWTNNGVVCTPWYNWSCTYCSASCELETITWSSCWDWIFNPNEEECDDNNFTNGDWCSATCKKEEIIVRELPWPTKLSVQEKAKEIEKTTEPVISTNVIKPKLPKEEKVIDPVILDLAIKQEVLSLPVPLSLPPNKCWNSVLEDGEGCDDWNTINGDWCNFECTQEVVKEVVIIKKTQARQQKLTRISKPKKWVWYTQPLPKSLSETWVWFFVHKESIIIFWIVFLLSLLGFFVIGRREKRSSSR